LPGLDDLDASIIELKKEFKDACTQVVIQTET
jgi:hypothetical protein